MKCLVAHSGEIGLELATKHLPSAIILDIRLPGMDGWRVLQILKADTRTRHIPVHVVSVEEPSANAIRRGAVGHAVKPLSEEALEAAFRRLDQAAAGNPKRVLVVEDDPEIRRQTTQLIGNGEVTVVGVGRGDEAMAALRSDHYDCMVLDLGLPDMDGHTLLSSLEKEGMDIPPVIVNTARELTRAEEATLREHAEAIVIKDVRSQERLLDEVSLFLHRVVSQMPDDQRRIIQDLYDTDTLLQGRKVMVVDDDMRTAFSVSRLLSDHGMTPLKADNGQRALRLLDEHPDVALVLMDIMMPGMDGYETMRRIRVQKRFEKLPMIALTAKAMPEDREKCLASGANDYLSKPVDAQRLISMMRVWLHR
ncbi:response regulator [Desulfosarcina cetonica]|uniref:response regulator n=1 Tax=Desulfosarcina cetonica TaxID=90730 RepID=UPI0006D0CEF0|nr:response regulator [Desulfosarcina cetonica]